MPSDTEKTLNGTAEPFRRPVVWGRPPATVFRTGPLPRSSSPSPLAGPAPAQRAPGILTGSMIPRSAPIASQGPAEVPDPSVTKVPEQREASTVPPPVAAAGPDLTVRSLPAVEPEAAQPPEPVRAAASPVPPVSPARKPASRIPLYAGIALAALTVLALGGWIWMRPPAEAPAPVAVTAPPLRIAIEAVAVPETLPEPLTMARPVAETPAPDITASPAATVPARIPPAATARPAQPVPVPVPRVAATPPVIIPAPRIEIAPVSGPAPTAAERPSPDPGSPMATRPQPIG